jgi:hypothetical protein
MQQQLEKRLGDLRTGALFTARDGMMAVKTGPFFKNGDTECLVLATGKYIHLSDMTPVREVELVEGQAVASEPEHEHTFTLAVSGTVVARMCTGCGMTWTLDYNRRLRNFETIWYQVKEPVPVGSNEEYNVPLEVQKEIHARIFDEPPGE